MKKRLTVLLAAAWLCLAAGAQAEAGTVISVQLSDSGVTD